MYLLALAGCAPKTTPSPISAPEDPCLLATGPAPPVDTFTVALAEPVEPLPYPGLIRLDCRGEVRPDIATEWSVDSTGHAWTFVLPEGAGAVLAGWNARWPDLQALGVDSARALDEKTLVVKLRGHPDDSLRLFAHPAFSTGSTAPHSSPPVVKFVTSIRGDLRDELDAGADLVVTRDPAVIEYAAQRAEFEIFPLPWSRTYVLAQRAGAPPLETELQDESVRRSLAEDAVRADAWPSQRPFWWDSPCSTMISPQVTIPTAPRVVYLQGDPVARQLAERIVALAPDSSRLTAFGMDSAGLTAARAKGADRAYIFSVPFRPISPCREAARLTRGYSITPLIDTRARAIVRRGSPLLAVEWDGTVRLAPSSNAPEGPP
jgi:hypothetical protein